MVRHLLHLALLLCSTHGFVLIKPRVQSLANKHQSLILSASSKNGEDDTEFLEFLEYKKKRSAATKSSFFSTKLSPVDIEVLLQLMEPVHVKKDEIIVKQGATDKTTYIVASGELECYDEHTGKVVSRLPEGKMFGELAYLLDEPRALSIRAATDSKVWKIEAATMDEVLERNKMDFQDSVVSGLSQTNEGYGDYLDRLNRQRALMAFPVFKNLEAGDMERLVDQLELVDVEAGELVIEEGAAGDMDSMYFVKSGSLECYKEKDGKTLKVYEAGDYFGELAVFFRTPRAASIRALSSGASLWRLTRDIAELAIQETSLGGEAYEVLQSKYKTDSLLATILQASPEELYDLVAAQSRPKKKPVSFHSILTTSTSLAVLVMLLPMLSPGIGSDGRWQIFNYNEGVPSDMIAQSHILASLQIVGALMGILRLPKNSPPSRELSMKSGAFIACAIGLTALTSLNGTDQYLFDAFSVPARLAFAVFAALATANSAKLIDCAIADDKRKGFDTLPLMENRPLAAVNAIGLYLAGFLVIQACAPLLMDKADYVALAKPYYSDVYNGALTVAGVAINQWIGFGALAGTLLFERKITPKVAAAVYAFSGIFLTYDAFKLVYDFWVRQRFVLPEAQNLEIFNQQLEDQYHVTAVYLGFMCLVILNGLRKLLLDEQNSAGVSWAGIMSKMTGIDESTASVPVSLSTNTTSSQ